MPKRLRSRRCRARPRRPARPGSAGSGSRPSALSSAAFASRSSASSAGTLSLSCATSAISACARASSFFAFAWPISFDSALRRSCASCAAAIARLALLVEGDQLRRQRREPALREAVVEGLRVVADEADVVHGWDAGLDCHSGATRRVEPGTHNHRRSEEGAVRGYGSRVLRFAEPRDDSGSISARVAVGNRPLLRRGACRPLLRALLLDHADREDRGLVEKQRRDRKGELADHVRRRQHRREHEDDARWRSGACPSGTANR